MNGNHRYILAPGHTLARAFRIYFDLPAQVRASGRRKVTIGLNHPPLTVPEGRYYLLGDNRDNSNDSRRWGTVRREELKGPVIFNYWSWNNQESWAAMLNPLTWLRLLWGEMRWDRIGMTHACEDEA